MRSIYKFIVEPVGGNLYNNTKSVDDSELIISSSIEDHKTTNRQAIVKSVPMNYDGPIEPGAIVVVHHNTFRKYLDIKGIEQYSKAKIAGDIYGIYGDTIYAYKNDWSQEWQPIPGYCFVSPVENDEMFSVAAEKALHGKMVYVDEWIKSQGVLNGDTVVFSEDSEYEFNIDDQKVYRVMSKDICLKV